MRKIAAFCSERKVNLAIKIIVCLGMCLYIGSNAMLDGMKPYYSARDYNVQIQIPSKIERGGGNANYSVTQEFLAVGNHLNKINLYWTGDPSDAGEFYVSLTNSENGVVLNRECRFSDYPPNTWNKIDVSISGLSKDSEYFLTFSTDEKGVELDQGFIELEFAYRYITVASALALLARFLIIAFFSGILCYGIMKIEQLYLGIALAVNKQAFFYALYLSVYMVLLFNPVDKLRKEAIIFTREIGVGYLLGHDVTRIIPNFFAWLGLLAVLFCIYFLVINGFLNKERDNEQREIIDLLNKVVVLADISLLFRCISYFYDELQSDNDFFYSSYLLAGMLIVLLLYVICKMDRWILAKTYRQLLMSAFGLGFPIAIISNLGWESGKLVFGVQTVLAFGVLAVLLVTRKWIRKIEHTVFIDVCTIVFSLFPFLTSFYIELTNVLNQHSIFNTHPLRYYAMACFFLAVAGFFFLVVVMKQKYKLTWWHNWAGVWLIVGFVCLRQQINLQNIYTPSLLEHANHGILIHGWLRFGEIPLVEHLSLHMMLAVWEGLIYAFLNGDVAGAALSPYLGYMMIPLALLFYIFIKKVWDEDMALWITLLFPFYGYWSEYAWGVLVVVAVLAFVRKNSYLRAALVWLACVWCALGRADTGLSFGVACCITLFIYIIYEKNWKAIKFLLYPLLVIGFSGVAIWCILCVVKGVNPITRLVEFLKLFAAGINWSGSNFGNEGNTVFAWGYIFVPFMVTISLIYVVFSKKFYKKVDQTKWLLLLMLGCAYLTNLPRTLQRHSLAEMATRIVFWTAYIYLALFFSCLAKKQVVFLLSFTGLILLNTLFVQDEIFTEKTIVDSSVEKLGTFTETWWKEIGEKQEAVQRIQYSDEFEETLAPYRFIFNTLLDEEDTFLDFIYNSYLYVAFDKRDPVYAAQSPVMLSGELSQEYFIDEISADLDSVPIALMPNNSGNHAAIDRVMLNYKYYKVAEFIYENYRPLCNYGDFSIWCLNDRYDEMIKLLADLPEFNNANSIMDSFLHADSYYADDCDIVKDLGTNAITLTPVGQNPALVDIQNALQLSEYGEQDVCIFIDYDTSVTGEMKVCYTTDKDEDYNNNKCVGCDISGMGTAAFEVPITQYTKLRLDIPEGGNVTIRDINLQGQDEWRMIDWGYDSSLHSYTSKWALHRLPLYWAELDRQMAADNMLLAEAERSDSGMYLFDKQQVTDKTNGNYLLLTTNYGGKDLDGLVDNDDEYTTATVILGAYEDDMFKEKYKYEFTIKEGKHSYLFRISSDYYWYLDRVNAIRIESNEKITETEFKILQGD